MITNVGDIIKVMESIAPPVLAEKWDNIGLQIGCYDHQVSSIWIALDPQLNVVESACKNNVDLLITHHPLIFNPLKTINLNTPVGKIIKMAVNQGLNIFCAHTNLDFAADGINDILANKIGLKNISVLKSICNESSGSKKEYGSGRVGDLEVTINLLALVSVIKEKLGLKNIRIAGDGKLKVDKVAICCGSGSAMMNDFFLSGAQVFISGDIKYHDARNAEEMNLALIDIGHFASEHIILDVLKYRLIEKFALLNFDVIVDTYKLENDPFIFY